MHYNAGTKEPVMRELPAAYAAESFVPFVLEDGRFNGEDAPLDSLMEPRTYQKIIAVNYIL